jgi:Tol biopolymer transport system component
LHLLLLLLSLFARPAAAMDPRFVWETIDTPHFEVHYHQGMYRYAQRVARAAELSHQRLVPLLDHEPRERTHIVVQDDTDFANGNATPVLYNLIHAYAAPPDSRSTLADFDDNVWELISHEYTHILHLDTVLGLPQATNSIFGKLWITNGEQPIWFIEGIAVFAESEVSGAGRERSSEEDMMVRAEVLEGTFPSIDKLSNVPLQWPRGFGQYTVGSRFIEWIRGEYGLGALRDLSHDYGARAIPFALNFSAGRVLGESYLDLYKEFGEAETQHASQLRAEVIASGESRIEPLTRLGEWIRTPRWSPGGKTLYYASSGADRLPEVRAVEPGPCCEATWDASRRSPEEKAEGAMQAMPDAVRPGDRRVAVLYSDGSGDDSLAVAPGGRIVYARKQVFQEFESLQDLYSVDPTGGDGRRETRGLRARGPDVAADGSIVFLWRKPGGQTAIAELRPGATEPGVLFEDPDGEPVDSPRFSPDGTRVAFLHHRDGSWDVRIVSRDGKTLTDVTHDRALDRDPAWTPDGKWLLFASDRTGIYNVYAWRPGELRQVTNVVFGAFEPQPSPDGTQLALVTYSARGYDLGRMPLDESSWSAVTAPPVAEQRPPPTPLPADEIYPARPYQAWPTLRPHFWLPYASADALGTTLGALTAGYDAVERHEYAAAAWWSLTGNMPGWDVYYLNHTLYPDLSVEISRDLAWVDGAGPRRGIYTERQAGGRLVATFPFSQVERLQSLSLGYDLFGLAVHSNPYGVVTDSGRLAAARITYAYSDARRFVRSISREEGQAFSVTLRLSDPALGSSYSFWQLGTSLSGYFALPWSSRGVPLHHALALHGELGISRGDLSNRHLYFLGGFQQANLANALLNPGTGPLRILRGFTHDAFVGEAYALGSAEYRFPLWDVETGAWTLPVYLRRLHAAVYTDVGDAYTPGRHDFKLHAGAGAELRAEVVLGWILPTDLRLGCARGLESSRAAILDCYVALGGEF